MNKKTSTRAEEIANKRFAQAILDPDRYPDRTAFIASDQADLGTVLANAATEQRPVAISFTDGREAIYTPASLASHNGDVPNPAA